MHLLDEIWLLLYLLKYITSALSAHTLHMIHLCMYHTYLYTLCIASPYSLHISVYCLCTSLYTLICVSLILLIFIPPVCWSVYTVEQGTMLPPKVLVYCMAPIDSSLMLLGTNTGVVYVYDGYDRKLKHQLAPLGDSVLCLLYFKWATVLRLVIWCFMWASCEHHVSIMWASCEYHVGIMWASCGHHVSHVYRFETAVTWSILRHLIP